ncbi:uncharacterized protein TRUGW13939_04643 [Talaromyces rugulosus]|uniref:Uncharacterized protein n=1 Tax=Talaromyces rugulosus TaxID=121627 RepID=A0A7H8QU86_TALRU|nr:uncharacterized protein TRUGW13939_04643 [Talaromyces rugulosus]QKX57527.1 hypothetical protein TRUGW13939_04643 [Talaromyces rugulosus]
MSYKNNYELWNPALATRRPSQMSEIDIILAQTYPHVAMLPYSSCCHCSYEEEEDETMSPSSGSTFMSDESIRSTSTQHSNSNGCAGSNKRTKIRSRLRKIFKNSSRSS